MERDGNRPEPDLIEQPEPEPAPRWVTTTVEEAHQADTLLRQAHITKTRGEVDKASHMVAEAYQRFPHYAPVVLAYVDELLARGRAGDAVRLLDEAVASSPPSLALDDKRAELVLKTRFRDTVDLDSLNDSFASAKTAVWLSVFLPGLGHMALERYQRGAWIMGAWVVGVGGLFLVPNGIKGLVEVINPKSHTPFNPLVLIPLAFALGAFAIAVAEMSQAAKRATTHRPEHPVPPANLPFE